MKPNTNEQTPPFIEERIFKCNFLGCNQSFKTKFSCKRHQLTHEKEKAFICTSCGKGFTLAQHLKEHSYRHTKSKPYVCGVSGCQQAFRHASELSLHRRTHPEYKLRKYNYSSEKPEVSENLEPLFKTNVTVEESKQIQVNQAEAKDFQIKLEHVPTSDTILNGESSAKSLANTIQNQGNTAASKKHSIDSTDIDTNYIGYLNLLTNSSGPAIRTLLPLPGISIILAAANQKQTICKCHCNCHLNK